MMQYSKGTCIFKKIKIAIFCKNLDEKFLHEIVIT